MANLTVTLFAPESAASLNTKYVGLNQASPKQFLVALENYIGALRGGIMNGGVTVLADDAVWASGTATLASAVATNALTVAGVTFTAVAPGTVPSNVQFAIGVTDAESATNLAAAINASANAAVAGVVRAQAVNGVVTVTACQPGTAGNAITLAKTGAPITVSGATLAGGAAGTVRNFSFGI
jgi:hypothetical protein